MSRLARAAVLLLAAATVTAEVERYRAERTLGRLTAAAESAQRAGRSAALLDPRLFDAPVQRVASHLPGDPRAPIVAGAVHLLARDAPGALAWYAHALTDGERAEVDLNIGRAAMMRHDLALAQAAFLRAGWLSPALLTELPEAARTPLLKELARRTADLQDGSAGAIPPTPVVPGG